MSIGIKERTKMAPLLDVVRPINGSQKTNGFHPTEVIEPILTKTKLPKRDPYELGWRPIELLLPDGQELYKRVPLSLHDILHPHLGDFQVHSAKHEGLCEYIRYICARQLVHDPTSVVFHDVRIDWGHPDIEPHGPDIAVFFGVKEQKDDWTTFDVKAEGACPALCIEITSPKTRHIDLKDKVKEYAKVGVPFYVIIDRHQTKKNPGYKLIGYQLTKQGYRKMKPNKQGWLWLDFVNIWLGVDQTLLLCYDKDKNPIGDYIEVDLARVEEKKRAEAEQQRADDERQRAEKAEALVATERQRAEAERQRADQIENQLSEAEAEIARLRALLSS